MKGGAPAGLIQDAPCRLERFIRSNVHLVVCRVAAWGGRRSQKKKKKRKKERRYFAPWGLGESTPRASLAAVSGDALCSRVCALVHCMGYRCASV